MSGPLATFAGKERRETLRTWRLWVLPGIMVFLAISSPVLTRLTPEILRSTAASQPGIVIHIPPPVARDAYEQFIGNLDPLVEIAVIIIGAAALAAERRSGTAVLVLTKPISRAGFVLLKAAAQLVVLACATALSVALCIATTVLLFGPGSIGPFLGAAGLWLAFAAMILLLAVLLSAALKHQAPAIGAGAGVLIGLLVLTRFPLIRDHSPAGVAAAFGAVVAGRGAALLWPLATTAVAGVVLLLGAVWFFRRQEL